MKTVEEMIKELKKFPLDAECFAYEGGTSGLIINKNGECGFIPCSEEEIKKLPTQLLKS